MAIVQQLDESYFIERFREMGRGDQFTYNAKVKLYEYLEQLSDDLGEDIKLDVIGLCCEWCESTPDQFIKEYDLETTRGDDETEEEFETRKKQEVLGFLEENTTALDCGDTLLYMAF